MGNIGEKSRRLVSAGGTQFVLWRDRIENVAPHLDGGAPRKILWWAEEKETGAMIVGGTETKSEAMGVLREWTND